MSKKNKQKTIIPNPIPEEYSSLKTDEERYYWIVDFMDSDKPTDADAEWMERVLPDLFPTFPMTK